MRYVFAILVFYLLSFSAECAEEPGDYLVIGNYEKERPAIAEGERLSRAAGVEILLLPVDVDGQPDYQLLVRLFTDEYDQARLESQLRYAGAGDMWRTSITGREPGLRSIFAVIDYDNVATVPTSPDSFTEPASVVKKNFYVAGSFRDAGQAQTLLQRLASSFEHVLVKTANVNGAEYHRVLVGPVEESAEEEYKIRTREAGVPDAWLLRDVPVEVADSQVMASVEPNIPDNEIPPRETARAPTTDRTRKTGSTQAQPEGPAIEFYNAAKMRKKPSPFF